MAIEPARSALSTWLAGCWPQSLKEETQPPCCRQGRLAAFPENRLQRTGHPQISLAVQNPEKGSMIVAVLRWVDNFLIDVCVFPFHRLSHLLHSHKDERNRKLGQGRTSGFGKEDDGPLTSNINHTHKPWEEQDGRIKTPWPHVQLVRSSAGSDKTAIRVMGTSFRRLRKKGLYPGDHLQPVHEAIIDTHVSIHLRLSTSTKTSPYRQMTVIHAGLSGLVGPADHAAILFVQQATQARCASKASSGVSSVGFTQASMSARGFHFGKHPEAVPPMMVCNERGRIVASNTVLGD
ncbi:hypothetical protein NEUTE1DRAFT_106822 [Neurospora tetrasperma FGSC 2508]|uniref:Uncharacterized protein n=1 Tax=Neurospora tetrasperma (strain FGSC 2508 / ATCC MYA-4615 / P0657) TaxID=510951 RepID=F8MAU9_NEUT8|nr:uncharacterized protein NEUTE1DRAFT_106822 [Neurospora tetrasperma FGSC 2508]EGO60167.1 hypothetical protein NEUTE1DRAFT_106822 [Neurospora tetrasperma FGSC 2508]EGZ75876.1 hypothetical protein NEUTE2DRAFT_126826 [Neurospora tetrasperma FGSC 2509]